MKSLKFVLTIFLLGLIPSMALSATYEVTVDENGFIPSALTIKKGDTVQWVNGGTGPHSVTSGDAAFGNFMFANGFFQSGTLNPEDTFGHTFTVPGIFSYFDGPDGIQSPRTGTIIVEGVAISPGDSIFLTTQSFDLIIYVTANYPDLMLSMLFDGAIIFDGLYSTFINVANNLGIETITTDMGASATIIPISAATLSRGTHTLNIKISAPSGFLAAHEVIYSVTREQGFVPFEASY